MKIVLNSMVHNETVHVASAMAHFSTLFDEIHVVDHRSDDGTLDAIKMWNSETCMIHGYTFDDKGYYQSEVMTFLARAQVRTQDADWVFFLDFDEYLPFRSRAEFEQALIQHAFHPAIQLRWHNLIPDCFGGKSHLGADYFVSPDASDYVKMAFQPKLLANYPGLVIEQGNHAVRYTADGANIPAEFAFGLFHIPIDSHEHLKNKIAAGMGAYKTHWEAGNTELGRHWRLIDEILQSKEGGDALLNSFIASYGDNSFLESLSDPETKLLAKDELSEQLFRRIKLDVAGVGQKPPKTAAKQSLTDRVLALSGAGVIECQPPLDPHPKHDSYKPDDGLKAGTLPAENELLEGIEPPETLDEFLARSLHKIDVFTPTAWGGHIPFMFALTETLRPRRFAELGSHYGASFFAACQIAKRLRLPTCAVAIDLWEGDPQAGYYGEEVYASFEALRKKHFEAQSRSIRSYFVDAAPHFENKSLDLIHIDGLHTYEAVKEDYETWQPKLTDNGVIIFHDTNEYQSGFGVWDFFSMIRKEATASFEFKHTHGLGVMAFGHPDKNPMIKVLQMMNADPVKTERHFSRQGAMAETEALYAFTQVPPHPNLLKVGRHEITNQDLLDTRTKVLWKLIMKRRRLKQARRNSEREQAKQ
ncbi:MAG: class I SAM-dependent methyltransferase [Paracoccaceae bacterium]